MLHKNRFIITLDVSHQLLGLAVEERDRHTRIGKVVGDGSTSGRFPHGCGMSGPFTHNIFRRRETTLVGGRNAFEQVCRVDLPFRKFGFLEKRGVMNNSFVRRPLMIDACMLS